MLESISQFVPKVDGLNEEVEENQKEHQKKKGRSLKKKVVTETIYKQDIPKAPKRKKTLNKRVGRANEKKIKHSAVSVLSPKKKKFKNECLTEEEIAPLDGPMVYDFNGIRIYRESKESGKQASSDVLGVGPSNVQQNASLLISNENCASENNAEQEPYEVSKSVIVENNTAKETVSEKNEEDLLFSNVFSREHEGGKNKKCEALSGDDDLEIVKFVEPVAKRSYDQSVGISLNLQKRKKVLSGKVKNFLMSLSIWFSIFCMIHSLTSLAFKIPRWQKLMGLMSFPHRLIMYNYYIQKIGITGFAWHLLMVSMSCMTVCVHKVP
jgi:hypothetical protein